GGGGVALDDVGEGLERGDVERVEAVGRERAGGGAERGEGREEAGEGLAGPGIGDEQGVAACAGGGEHVGLVAAQAPAARGEPGGEFGGKVIGGGWLHGPDIGLAPGRRNGWQQVTDYQ